MGRTFYFTPSYYCSSDCLMCGVAKAKRDTKLGYSFEDAISIVDKMQLEPGDILEISGGEPTAYKHLPSLCKYVKDQFGADVLILSHGRHLKNIKLATQFADAGVSIFLIPIFSLNEKKHDYLTQVQGSFYETLIGIENLIKLKIPVSIKFIPMKTNYMDLPETFLFCKEKFPTSKFIISGYQMMGEAYTNSDLVSPKHSEVKPYINEVLRISSKYNYDVAVTFVPLCHIDPYFWNYYGAGFQNEIVYSPDSIDVCESNERNYSNKPPECSMCVLKLRCQWSWHGYTKVFGTSELTPFTVNQ